MAPNIATNNHGMEGGGMATMTAAGDNLVIPVAKEQRKRRKKKKKSVEATENSENSPQNGMTKEHFATDDPEAVDVDAPDKISKSKARKLRRQRQKQRYVNASETKTNRSEKAIDVQPTVDLQPERKTSAKSNISAVDSIVEIVENAPLQDDIHENRRDHSSMQISAIGDKAVSETNLEPESTTILGNVPFEREAASGTTAVYEISPPKETFTPGMQRTTDDVASDIVDKVIAVDYQPATEVPSSTVTQNASQIVVEEEARAVGTASRGGVIDAYNDHQETAKEDCSCAACTMM